ncbi:MAG: hypothetical protein ABIZ91_13240 [Gemmatimonadaceae bacterium]
MIDAAAPSLVAATAIAATPVSPDVAAGIRHTSMALPTPVVSITCQFTVNPGQSQSFIVCTHMVAFPANTICDPATSGYGSSYWLQGCTKLTTPIVITATTWIDSLGRAQIDFANDIRFYPNASGQLPAVYLRDATAALSSWSRIDYGNVNGCVNEAAADAVLVTKRDPVTGYLFRLVRHFSGYNVLA